MSDLQYRPGGSLKLKGEGEGGKKKKSKKKNAAKLELTGEEPIKTQALLKRKDAIEGTSAGGAQRSDSPSGTPGGPSSSRKTDAERRFEQIQKRRLLDKVSKMASKTHKDRVQEFNAKLEQASDHHDIPKVGPG
ncbi:hypothetical protein FRC17_001291 [Serendipita sp. 399]|nr:hypothetical protein FRC17_001291 [Serendipita sp. 399]